MKNKNAAISIETMIVMALALIIFFLIVKFVILEIFVNKQISGAGSLTDKTTADFDKDTTPDLIDKCPCDAYLNPDELTGKCPTLKDECNKKMEEEAKSKKE
jgi:hypothetical protein